ncbi:hypothetical protein BXZ70DRAFT_757256 [Cristinia sonorae]|uniref:DUF6534 domain-containing protein n=1 Tax=Cristinia sonorae TaxID=1940300 RepID=A0A8K0UUG2_9AGAR|nr:hypothetical protein BXZ70DRAFT_757256 [Cristinia sonorae]
MDASLPTVAQFFGACFITLNMTFVLYGISVAQGYEYAFFSKSRDSSYIKVMVCLVLLVETIHTGLVIHFLYYYAVTATDNPALVLHIAWSSAVKLICESIVVMLVHSFYIRRIWIVSGRKLWLVAILAPLLIARTAFSLSTAGLMYVHDNWIGFRDSALFTSAMSCTLLAVTDFSIASTMSYYLYVGRGAHESTNRLLHTLMAYCVNTGLVTMFCSFITLGMFVGFPERHIFAGLVDVGSKLYANSLLGSLNMRTLLRDIPKPGHSLNFNTVVSTNIQFGSGPIPSNIMSVGKQIEIYQQTSTMEVSDATRRTTMEHSFHE